MDKFKTYKKDEVQKISPILVKAMEEAQVEEVSLPIIKFSEEAPNQEVVEKFAELNDIEIFRVGKWNGDTYTKNDLESIVDNFEKLKEKRSVPIKLGHSENQDMLKSEGLPAAGWVKKLKIVGDRLVADIKDVPERIKNLVSKKAYTKVSSEIYPIYKDSEGTSYNKVLRAVALLGGDIPAVEGLKDIEVLYNSENGNYKIYTLEEDRKGGDSEMKVKTLAIKVSADKFEDDFNDKLKKCILSTFGEASSVNFEEDMMNEDMKAKMDDMMSEMEAKDEEIAKLKAEIEKLKGSAGKEYSETITKFSEAKAKIVELETKLKVAEEKIAKASNEYLKFKEDLRMKEIDAIIADGEKSGRILPVHRDQIKAMLTEADVNKVIKFSQDNKVVEKSHYELVKEYVNSMPVVVNFNEISKTGEHKEGSFKKEITVGNETFEVDDAEFAASIEKYALDNKVSYETAFITLSKTKK